MPALAPPRTTEIALAYRRGVYKREELLDIARKVKPDLAELAAGELVDPYLQSRLDTLLESADEWRRAPLDLRFAETDFVRRLEQEGELVDVDLSHEVHAWEQSMIDLLEVITGLGNHCFVRLKKQRRAHNSAPVRVDNGDFRPLKRRNAILNNIEILLGRTALQSYPFQMEIDPTNDCNLKCRACQHSLLEHFYRAELRPEYMDRMRDAFPFVDYVHLYGNGEPFLSSILAPMTEIARQYQCTVDVLTNGTRLSRVDFDWSRIDRLGISFDGASDAAARMLRPPSRVPVILEGIRRVRREGPHLTIYAKVTISRVNLDELAAIVECLGEAGVNEVILHSLRSYHPDQLPLQVRTADRPFAMDQLRLAEATASRLGVKLVSTITFDDFALPERCARNKGELLVFLENLRLPPQRVPGLQEIAARLQCLEFSYYPRRLAEASARVSWLRTRETVEFAEQARDPLRPVREEVDALIRTLAQQARSREAPAIPYCLMPWKLPFIDPDGRARICDFLTDFVGDMQDATHFGEVWNSPAYQKIRRAMFDTSQLSQICRECVSDCRGAFGHDTMAVADMLGVNVREHPSFPVRVNLSSTLNGWFSQAAKKIETCGEVRFAQQGTVRQYILPPDSQLVVRFPHPRSLAHVYYRGKFRITGGRVLVGIKDWGQNDLWNHWLEPGELALLGEWVGLPMPPLPIDFSNPSPRDCCLFLWADLANAVDTEIHIAEFDGVKAVPSKLHMDGLQVRHIWSAPAQTQ